MYSPALPVSTLFQPSLPAAPHHFSPFLHLSAAKDADWHKCEKAHIKAEAKTQKVAAVRQTKRRQDS